MQILELVLYGKNGQKRTLSFKPGKVNIIPGESKAGKSAVGDIIEYCMGGSSCNIAVGIVRDNVAWYGLLLQFNTNKIFVARKILIQAGKPHHFVITKWGQISGLLKKLIFHQIQMLKA